MLLRSFLSLSILKISVILFTSQHFLPLMTDLSENSIFEITKELSLYSYEMEDKREQSLLDQAGKMILAMSVFTVALLAFISLEACGFSNNQILMISGVTFLPLGLSFLFSVLTLWRDVYWSIGGVKEIDEKVRETIRDGENPSHLVLRTLNSIWESKKEKNDKSGKFIRWSTVLFIVSFIISFMAIAYCLLYNHFYV